MTHPTTADESARTAQNESLPNGANSDLHAAEQMLIRVCPRCNVQSQTVGGFCPNCAAPYGGPVPRSRIGRRVVIGLVVALAVIGSATGLALKIDQDKQAAAQRVATAQAQERSADAAKAKADNDASAAAAKQTADDQTRTDRQATVSELEASILKDAKKMVKSQTLAGPILSASCTPLGGGSSDDLTALTGTFECIAVNKKNADGTSSGYRFAATINWNKDYTWRLGS